MQDDRQKKQSGWGSAIGWIIFIVLVGARPISQLIQGLLGGAVSLPSNLLPIAAGALVLLVVIVSAVRALANAGSASSGRLPTGPRPPMPPANSPMPPFGGQTSLPRQFPVAPPRDLMPRLGAQPRVPQTPRFDPVINPALLLVGILGLIALGGLALVVFVSNTP